MNKTIIALLAGLALGAASVWLVPHPEGGKSEREEKAKEKPEPKPVPGTNDESALKLPAAAQQKAGLRLAHPEAVKLAPQIKGYGRVLDPAPLAALWVEITSARAALEASAKERDRTRALFAQDQNASARALEQAEAAWKRDQLTLTAAQARLLTGWGKAITERHDIEELLASLTSLRSVMARVDVSPGDAPEGAPTAVRVAALNGEHPPGDAELIGPAPSMDPQTQGPGYLVLVHSNAPPPGTALVGYLGTSGAGHDGVVIPRSALVRKDGETFIYVQTAPEIFARRKVELVTPLPEGWFVTEGVSPADQLVVAGAQELLSEELKGENEEE